VEFDSPFFIEAYGLGKIYVALATTKINFIKHCPQLIVDVAF